MPQTPLVALLEYLGKTCGAMELESLTDGKLLERFVRERDEAAFAVLMHRHGPMVFGVCRRMLGDGHDADDAFQATFLVLVRRAASVEPHSPLASWLYGVAQRVALKARARAAARHHRQRELTDMPRKEPLDDMTWRELRPLLDEEVGRLPEKCRVPMVLCYFEGKSYDEAAQELGWPKSTLASRLGRGRELLRQRLVKRGITLSAGAVATALIEHTAQAGAAALLTINTVKAAASAVAGKPITQGLFSAQALALAEETMKTMIGIKGKVVAVLLALGLAVGAAYAGYEAWVRQAPPGQQGPRAQRDPDKKEAADPAVDLPGDPLPAGAVARMGKDRWLHDIMARFVAFTPDGKKVVTVSVDRTIRVWDFPSGKEIRRIHLPAPDLSAANPWQDAALSNDGKTIATWLPEKSSIYLHDLATGKQLQGLKVSSVARKAARKLAFSPDSVHLACLTPDSEVRIWDWAKAVETCNFVAGEPIKAKAKRPPAKPTWPLLFLQGRAICYAPDGKAIATLLGQHVKLWDPVTGREIRTLRSEATGNPLTIAFSPDGTLLAITIAAGRQAEFPPNKLEKAKVTEDAVVLVKPGNGEEIRKLTAPQLLFNPSGGGPSLIFARDSKRLYVSNYEGDLYEWDVSTGDFLRDHHFYTPGTGPMMGASLSPDGNVVVRTGVGPPVFSLGGKEITLLHRPAAPVVALQFTGDGKQLLTMSRGIPPAEIPSARKWDVATGRDLGKVDLHGLSAPVAISPNHKFLAGNRVEISWQPRKVATVKLLRSVLIQAASGKELPLPVTQGDYDRARIRFSPDSKILAFGQTLPKGKGRNIGLYDSYGAKLRHTLELQENQPFPQMWRTLIFSPDSKLLAARADPKTLGVWDTTTGQRIGSIPLPEDAPLVYPASGHQDLEDSAAFSPDGRCLVLDMEDGTAGLYELATGRPRRTFGAKVAPTKGPPKMSYLVPDELKAGSCFAFSPDGKLLARGGFDQIVRVWDVQTGRPLAAFKGHGGAVTSLAFSPDGKTLASGSADSTALIWDVSTIK
jgi:RNA polymerase sigma factor (sigma-70 family)